MTKVFGLSQRRPPNEQATAQFRSHHDRVDRALIELACMQHLHDKLALNFNCLSLQFFFFPLATLKAVTSYEILTRNIAESSCSCSYLLLQGDSSPTAYYMVKLLKEQGLMG
jgi:hypothetical protein